jgi:hypothetical protein
VLGLALCLLLPAAAFAYGYNDAGYNFTTGTDVPGENSGLYVRDPQTGAHIRSYQGPHGGYTTTTNKCKDCHAVHLAEGAFMLMRADTRVQACDFCHTGGGGSKTNIQMDNAYDGSGVVPTGSAGYGTGHTVGYSSPSPLDIKPAYTDPLGLMCFDCHSPHGNSDRVLATYANPGRRTSGPEVTYIYSGSTLETIVTDPGGLDITTYNGGIGEYWGISAAEGNIVSSSDGAAAEHSVWPASRMLLRADPHSQASELATDTVVGTDPGSAAELGYNKISIDWDSPIGPADSSNTGDQDALNGGTFYGGTGLLSVGEFCTDCHDGAAGASTQQSTVWVRDPSAPAGGTYMTTYSHDSQPRDHERQMILNPGGTADNPDGTDDNFGPTCRQCHIGGSSCDQCHGVDPTGAANNAYTAYTPVNATQTAPPEDGTTAYWPQAYVSKLAIPDINSQCVDGGFSWPHRTLGINLLGDELYGVDFDGTHVAPGETRLDADSWFAGYLDDQPYASETATDTWKPFTDDTPDISATPAENLDSACISCHGDATFWNGDDDTYRVATPSVGWELVLKGLP